MKHSVQFAGWAGVAQIVARARDGTLRIVRGRTLKYRTPGILKAPLSIRVDPPMALSSHVLVLFLITISHDVVGVFVCASRAGGGISGSLS